MPNTHNVHAQAAAGVQLRGFGYTTFATVAAMNLVTGRPGEICTVTADGYNYQWNNTLSRWARLVPKVGGETAVGVLDWDDASNLTEPYGPVLLTGNATNGPGPTTSFHVRNIGYTDSNSTITQIAEPYGVAGHIASGFWVRGRFSGTWSTWRRIDPLYGTVSLTGTLDFNDATNARNGAGTTLMTGVTALNAPSSVLGAHWIPFCFEHGVLQNGTGDLTQLAVPYGNNASINAGMWMRGRVSGTWGAWRRIDRDPVTCDQTGGVGATRTGTRSGIFIDGCAAIDLAGASPEAVEPAVNFPLWWRQPFTNGQSGAEVWIVAADSLGNRIWKQIA